MYMYTIFCRR